jgi:histone deacetylase 1/2
VAKIDFPGAYLNTPMPKDGNKVYMRLNKFETKILIAIDPSFKKYVNANMTCVVRLNRALYGCIESAKLWYNKLSSDLMSMGYRKNVHDICVFNRIEKDGSQSTLVIHVDDVLITAKNEDNIDQIITELQNKYAETLTVQRGKIIEYIGMVFDFNVSGQVKVTMNGYVEDVLKSCDTIAGTASTPATNDLFKIKTYDKQLSEEDKEYYHSVVAKLLYLAKRVRPDLLVSVSFLSKRVKSPNIGDFGKLERVIKYLRGTKQLGIILEAHKILGIFAYVDASYGVHMDYKSHTGIVIGLGKGLIYAKSTSQKLNTKSSTESELVGISDSAGYVIWVRNFLIEQGYSLGPAKIFQDNMSTIAMIKNGKSNSDKSRHIAIRFFFVKDRVETNEISIEYLRTDDMIADILTKPLQGSLFRKLRGKLLNWYED